MAEWFRRLPPAVPRAVHGRALALGAVLLAAATALTACGGGRSGADPSPSAGHPTPVHVRGAIKPTGPWGVATRTGNTLYIAGMRGIDPKTNKLVPAAAPRIRQAFENMRHIARSQGADLKDAVRLVVYVTDMDRYRPIVNQVQKQLWGHGPYPPRTIVQVTGLNQHDIVEVEGTFVIPK